MRKGATEISQATWGCNADTPAMSAIVQKNRTYSDFVMVEIGNRIAIFDQQGTCLEEFFGVRDIAGSCAS